MKFFMSNLKLKMRVFYFMLHVFCCKYLLHFSHIIICIINLLFFSRKNFDVQQNFRRSELSFKKVLLFTAMYEWQFSLLVKFCISFKGGSRHEVHHYEEIVIFFTRHFSNSSIFHRIALAAWAPCLDPRLSLIRTIYLVLLIFFF